MLTLLLFATFTVLFLAFCYAREYEASPATLVYDAAKSRLDKHLFRGDRELLYQLAGRDPYKVAKTGALLGGAMGGLAVFLSGGGAVSFMLVPLLAMAGVIVFDAWAGLEYRQWQESVIDGVPALISFLPAFLETSVITPRQALELTIPFLPEPLRSELGRAVHRTVRTGAVKAALAGFADRVKHPVVDAITFRLSAMWDARVAPEIFRDLDDQIRNIEEIAAARATAAKSGLIALLCVIGLVGAVLEFGYPAWQYFAMTMGGMFMR